MTATKSGHVDSGQLAGGHPNGGPLAISLDVVSAVDLLQVGGKAANLGELIQAGFPVPPGFVISTTAYDAVISANNLAAAIAAATSSAASAVALRDAMATATIPPDIEQAILVAYRRLGEGAVAVRSSATAEDLPAAAFAGQQDTFLGILDPPALLTAVRRCWASLWSDRAISYREQHGFDHVPAKMAVVVQRLVAADAAGVLFTANPVTGARDETVIEASTGLGEAVVAGLVTPDHVILRRGKLGWRIAERHAGRREVEIRPRPEGGVAAVTAAASAGPILPDAVLRRLASLGAAIAHHFGRPQDVEWAWAGDQIAILQARPMTALPAPPAPRPRLDAMRAGPAEYMQIRPYPLDASTWVPAVGRALSRMLPLGNAMPSFGEIWLEEDGVPTVVAGTPRLRPGLDLALAPVRLLALAARYDPAHWRDDPIVAETRAWVRSLDARDPRTLTWTELLATAREAMAIPEFSIEIRRRYLPRALLAALGLHLALSWLGYPHRFGDLLSGVDNLTLAANRELAALAMDVRATPQLAAIFATHAPAHLWQALEQDPHGQALLERLHEFLDRYGHRETGSPMLVSQPTWKDAPETILAILKGQSLVAPATREGPPLWETARDEVLSHPAFQQPWLREGFLRLLSAARTFPSLREDTHFALTLPLPVLRRTLLEFGRRLVDVGVLAHSEDVFHLRFSELERVGQSWPPPPELASALRETTRRRAARRLALEQTPVMALGILTPGAPASDALLAGTPGSPGVATGPVRIVRDASAFGSLQPGDILVAPYTNPSWTPLFRIASAAIVDTGAAASHAAIVAREYGIPAVMGTGDGTRRLSDGQRVRVDGARGLVYAADPATP